MKMIIIIIMIKIIRYKNNLWNKKEFYTKYNKLITSIKQNDTIQN